MSAPDTNIEKQKTRHRPSLIGIAIAVTVVIAFVIGAAMLQPGDQAAPELVAPAATD